MHITVQHYDIFKICLFIWPGSLNCMIIVATPPCETLTLVKQAMNNKLRGSLAAYLRHGGVVNNQIKKGL